MTFFYYETIVALPDFFYICKCVVMRISICDTDNGFNALKNKKF